MTQHISANLPSQSLQQASFSKPRNPPKIPGSESQGIQESSAAKSSPPEIPEIPEIPDQGGGQAKENNSLNKATGVNVRV